MIDRVGHPINKREKELFQMGRFERLARKKVVSHAPGKRENKKVAGTRDQGAIDRQKVNRMRDPRLRIARSVAIASSA